MATDKGIVTINQVDVEEYLTSVISSEMSANASKELLKAHAVISRSWLLAQVEKNFSLNGSVTPYKSCYRDNETLIRWYDREDMSCSMSVPTTIASVTKVLPGIEPDSQGGDQRDPWRGIDG